MRSAAVVAVGALAILLFAGPSAQAADQCRGLQVCIPVAGPWVVIPAPTASERYPVALWRLKCPRGSIVGGVDARLRERSVDVTFSGLLGSPVNPGITTTDEVVFRGTYTGRARHATAFRPFIGCIPTSGGGRIPTVAGAVKPGRPTVLRVRSASLRGGTGVSITHSCARGERLVSSSQAVGLRGRREPTQAVLAGVRSVLFRRGAKLVARAVVRGPRSLEAKLQVQAVCTTSGASP